MSITTMLIPADQDLAREAGFRLPVYLTREVFDDCVAWTEADDERTGWPQDETGRLWDVLFMAAQAARRSGRRLAWTEFGVYRVPRTIRREEAARREDEGEEVAELVRLALHRDDDTLVIGDGDRMTTPTRLWCSYLLRESEGIGLAYGWAIDSRGARGCHGPTEYLVEPERGGPAVWRHRSHIDFNPICKAATS